MMYLESLAQVLPRTVDVLRSYAPLEGWLSSTWLAVGAAVAGGILSLWGARLLRAVFVLACMAAGGAAGIRIVQGLQQDMLIGLVLGAGVAGVVGYLLYRFWVGLMAGLVVALAVALWVDSGRPEGRSFPPQVMPQAASGLEYQVGRPETDPLPQAAVARLAAEAAGGFIRSNAGIGGMLLGLAAFMVGLMLPRVTTILATAALGSLLLAVSVGLWLAVHRPDWWAGVVAHRNWLLAATGLWMLVSLSCQGRHTPVRRVVAAAVPAQPAPAR